MGFSRQGYWSGLPFPSPGNLPYPEIKLVSPVSPALAGRFSTNVPPRRGRRWHPTPVLLLENPMDGGAWWAAVHGVEKSQTRLSDFTYTFHFLALEKEMATHSTVLACRIPWMGEPGGLPSMGSHRVRHDWSDLAAAQQCHLGSQFQFRNTLKQWFSVCGLECGEYWDPFKVSLRSELHL